MLVRLCVCVVNAVNTASTPVQAVFRGPPRMTKTEVKEYLTKIYDVPVAKVHTMNYLGNKTTDGAHCVCVCCVGCVVCASGVGSVFGMLCCICIVMCLLMGCACIKTRQMEAILGREEGGCVQEEELQESNSDARGHVQARSEEQ